MQAIIIFKEPCLLKRNTTQATERVSVSRFFLWSKEPLTIPEEIQWRSNAVQIHAGISNTCSQVSSPHYRLHGGDQHPF